MKNLLLAFLVVCGVAANAAEHKFVSLISGPLSFTNAAANVVGQNTVLGDATGVTYTNSQGVAVQAGTALYYFAGYTNTVSGITNSPGLYTNRGTINNANWAIAAPAWSDSLGQPERLVVSVGYKRSATAAASGTVQLIKSYNGIDYDYANQMSIIIPVTVFATTPNVVASTNSSDWFAGVRAVKIYTFAAATNDASTVTITSLGLSGFKP